MQNTIDDQQSPDPGTILSGLEDGAPMSPTLQVGIQDEGDEVTLRFAREVDELKMSREEAEEFAFSILEHANEHVDSDDAEG